MWDFALWRFFVISMMKKLNELEQISVRLRFKKRNLSFLWRRIKFLARFPPILPQVWQSRDWQFNNSECFWLTSSKSITSFNWTGRQLFWNWWGTDSWPVLNSIFFPKKSMGTPLLFVYPVSDWQSLYLEKWNWR